MKCRKGFELAVYSSYAGYYIGTFGENGPQCRLSEQYWKKREDAQKALDTMSFQDRENAIEVQWCNEGKGCLCNTVPKLEKEISDIATDHGSLEILTAYLMRSRKMSFEKATDTVCNLDEYLDHMFDDIEEHESEEEEYIPSPTNGDYSPSNPWDAPGMNVSDFI